MVREIIINVMNLGRYGTIIGSGVIKYMLVGRVSKVKLQEQTTPEAHHGIGVHQKSISHHKGKYMGAGLLGTPGMY